jgi:hypothetical protein
MRALFARHADSPGLRVWKWSLNISLRCLPVPSRTPFQGDFVLGVVPRAEALGCSLFAHRAVETAGLQRRCKQIPPKALRVTLSKGRLGGGDLNSDAWELLDFRAEAKHLDEYSVLIQMCLTDGRKGIRRFAFVISYKARGDL